MRRIARALVLVALVLACMVAGEVASFAQSTPSPSPSDTSTSSPSPSSSPTGSSAPSPSTTPCDSSPSSSPSSSSCVSVVQLSDSQWQPILFGLGVLVFLSAATFVASWRVGRKVA